MNYYNEFDNFAADWLENLINAGLIPTGIVDRRSIKEVQPDDLQGYTQSHFFAGVAGWPEALRLAGWDGPCWTGSCPCQPYSSAGKRQGNADERNLWPEFYRLIAACRPPVIFGEQVASADIVGTAEKNENMQALQDREAVFGVLRQLQGESAMGVQGLRPGIGAHQEAGEAGKGIKRLQEMAERKTWPCSCECGEESSENERDGIQSFGRGHTGENRQGGLRANRHSIRPDDAESMECTIARSNRLESGLHAEQYASGAICPKCGGEYLGRESDFGDCVGDYSEATGGLGQFVTANWLSASEVASCRWLDGVFTDLEREGYACGAAVLGAHSVGAPHIRQRLYWVADARPSRHNATGQGIKASAGEAGESKRIASELGRRGRHRDGLANAKGTRESSVTGGARQGVLQPDGCSRLGDTQRDGLRSGGRTNANEPDQSNNRTLLANCRDGKARRFESGSFPLAHAIPRRLGQSKSALASLARPASRNRVGRLRGYGNAIVPKVAAEFIKAFMEFKEDSK
jgi:site-specific DNA-cytosine methylase